MSQLSEAGPQICFTFPENLIRIPDRHSRVFPAKIQWHIPSEDSCQQHAGMADRKSNAHLYRVVLGN
jgi:hypothetical protein